MGSDGDGTLNNPYWATWVWGAWNNPQIYNLVRRYTHRPAEQLYHTAEDPFELTNLAQDPSQIERKRSLAAELDRWLASQGDPGQAQDTPATFQAARQGKHLYGPPDVE